MVAHLQILCVFVLRAEVLTGTFGSKVVIFSARNTKIDTLRLTFSTAKLLIHGSILMQNTVQIVLNSNNKLFKLKLRLVVCCKLTSIVS